MHDCKDLTEDMIRDQLKPAAIYYHPHHGLNYRSAAVLIPFFREDGEWHLLFTRRTEKVQDHKGQVAFPGGAVDPEDHNPVDTALREACEETGMFEKSVRVLGRLKAYKTITNYYVTPIVGVIEWPFELKLSEEEVSRVFTIPLCWLADPVNRVTKIHTLPSGTRHRVIYFKTYDGEIVWGVTARITVSLLQALSLAKKNGG